MRLLASTLLLAGALLATPASAQTTRQFEAVSADGYRVQGQADLADARTAVIFVAGTGLFDRDVRFGNSGGPRDLIFADLARRLTARGISAVRYDRRGVRYGATGAEALDRTAAASATVETQRDDLAAVYAWTRAADGLNAQCVILLGHSEGMAHIGRLAETDAPPPLAVIGIGAMLESPATGFRWRFAQRDAYSLGLMDADGDGVTTNAEVEANYERTPSAVKQRVDLFLHPSGAWTAESRAALEQVQQAGFERIRAAVLAMPDAAPYPDAQTPMASYAWWKSWFTDDTPIAQHLARWHVDMIFHYGSIDSQTNYERERGVGEPLLGRRATFLLHPGLGHTLGPHVTVGPMDERMADHIADNALVAFRNGCA